MSDAGVTFTGGGEKDLEQVNRNTPTQPNQPRTTSGGPVIGPDQDGTPSDKGSCFAETSPSWDAVYPIPKGGSDQFDSPVDDFGKGTDGASTM